MATATALISWDDLSDGEKAFYRQMVIEEQGATSIVATTPWMLEQYAELAYRYNPGAYLQGDADFMHTAVVLAKSAKSAAILASAAKVVIASGVDSFPAKVTETDPRLHIPCEMNAILAADQDLLGATLYMTPLAPTVQTAGYIIQAGIIRCVAPVALDATSAKAFHEAGVDYAVIKGA